MNLKDLNISRKRRKDKTLETFFNFLEEIKIDPKYYNPDFNSFNDLFEHICERLEYSYSFKIPLGSLPQITNIFKKYNIKMNYHLKNETYIFCICVTKYEGATVRFCHEIDFNEFNDIINQIIKAPKKANKTRIIDDILYKIDDDYYSYAAYTNDFTVNSLLNGFNRFLKFLEFICKELQDNSRLMNMRLERQKINDEINVLTKKKQNLDKKNIDILNELISIELM